jgi:hypothetical protein
MFKFKKLHLLLLVSIAMNICNVYASDDANADTRTASSSSSSFSSGESDEAFQEQLNGLLKVSTSKTLPHLMNKLEADKIEQERYMGLIGLASPQRLPFMLNRIKTYVALEQERLIGLLKVEDPRSACMLNDLNKAANKVLEGGPETSELSETAADPKKYPYRTSTGKLVSEEDYQIHTIKVSSTVLTSNLTNPYKAHLMLRVNLEYLNSFGLTRRWNKED